MRNNTFSYLIQNEKDNFKYPDPDKSFFPISWIGVQQATRMGCK